MMTFDVSTLDFAGGVVAFASGLFLLIHWWQARGDRAALWWGAASCGMGVGIILLALQAILPLYASTVAGPLILDVCAAGTWAAARLFNRGSIEQRPLIVAVGVWLAILIVCGATGHDRVAGGFGLAVSACLYAAAAVEFWLARSERLRGRWPMISLLSMNAIAVFLLAIQVCLFRPLLETPSTSWLGAIRFVGLSLCWRERNFFGDDAEGSQRNQAQGRRSRRSPDRAGELTRLYGFRPAYVRAT